jgi:hypothetical protein
MASPFKRIAAVNVGVAPVDVGTVPALKVWTLIDASCANVEPGLTDVKGTVQHVMGATVAHLIKNGPVPAGSAMVVVGAPRKVVLIAGDIVRAVCDKANGMDVTLSYLEQDA